MADRSLSRRPAGPRRAVGVDLGGTSIRVLVLPLGRGRARLHHGPAPTLEALLRVLRSLWRKWRLRDGDVSALVVASRHIWRPAQRRRLEARLGGLAGYALAVSDAEAAYVAALGARRGILLLAGTGSIAVGLDRAGRFARRGGHGPRRSDEGSAFWIGREALRRGAAGIGPAAARALLGRSRAPTRADVRRIAALAPGVLRRAARGDAAARGIVREAQAHLADLAAGLARALRVPAPVPLGWAGGLMERPAFRAGVLRRLRAAGLAVVSVSPRVAPVLAAARLARSLAHGGA